MLLQELEVFSKENVELPFHHQQSGYLGVNRYPKQYSLSHEYLSALWCYAL